MAQADSDSNNWQLPDGVELTEERTYWTADDGVSHEGSIIPGDIFYHSFDLTNNSSEAVTVTGFASDFFIQMNPKWDGIFAPDYCMQFFEVEEMTHRQPFPQVIAPGETAEIKDNATYHFMADRPSNECQAANLHFGVPSFLIAETAVPVAPVWRDSSCDAEAAVWIPETVGVVYAINGIEAQLADTGSDWVPTMWLGGAAVLALGVGLVALAGVRELARR